MNTQLEVPEEFNILNLQSYAMCVIYSKISTFIKNINLT